MANSKQFNYYDTYINDIDDMQGLFNYLMHARFRYQKTQLELLPRHLREELYNTYCQEDEDLRQKFRQYMADHGQTIQK